MSDVADLFYNLLEINELKLDIDIHDKISNDIKSEDDRWYTGITIYGNVPAHNQNADFCNMLWQVTSNYMDFETYSVTKYLYYIAKERTRDYYNLPLT